MTGIEDWEDIWWNPYEDDPSNESDYTMVFDIDGGYNFTLLDGNGTEVTTGEFELDMEGMKLTIVPKMDAHIPNQYEPECDASVTAYGVFDIKELTDGSLILFQNQSQYHPDDYDYGWVWQFEAK